MAPLRYAAKFDPFLSLDCAPKPSTLAQSKERKRSNFAIWQHWIQDMEHGGSSGGGGGEGGEDGGGAAYRYNDDLDCNAPSQQHPARAGPELDLPKE